MNRDIEGELRELFRDKAEEAPAATPDVSAGAPQEVLRRGRLHQIGTVVGSAAIAFALVAGSVAGLNSLLRGGDRVGGTGDYEVFERTATIEAFTMTSPSDWYLVNHWPRSIQLSIATGNEAVICMNPSTGEILEAGEACRPPFVQSEEVADASRGYPVFQLSSVDLGLDTTACGSPLPPDAAAFVVSYTGLHVIDSDPLGEWPGTAPSSPQDVPCGAGQHQNFTLDGYVFFAWIGFGTGVSEADRATVMDAFESMTVADTWEPAESDDMTPAYVMAGGVGSDGEPWRLELRPSSENVELSLEGSNTSEVGGISSTVPDVPIHFCCPTTDGTDPAPFLEATFGFITKDATGVELHVADADFEPTGEVLEGTILPLPPSLDVIEADVFFIGGTAGLLGSVVPVMPEADVSPAPVDEIRAPEVELTGSFEGRDWSARFTGSFADGTACVYVIVGEPYEPFCAELARTSFGGEWPYFNGTLTPDVYLLTGSVPPEITEIRFLGDDDAIVPQQVRCATGPLGWTDPDKKVCAIALPSAGSGTIEYLDAEGNVLFEEGMGWGSAGAESNEYPWTNEDGTITARGSFQGAEWTLEVLHYEDGYRLTFDGSVVFEGQLRNGVPTVVPLARSTSNEPPDTIVLVLTGTQTHNVSVVHASGQFWTGRWVPGSSADGGKARLWVIELPGAGTGTLQVDGVDQGEVSWP